MTAPCVIVIPFDEVNEYVLESIRGCLALDYSPLQLALLSDGPVRLPQDIVNSNRTTILTTGKLTIAAKRNMAIRRFPNAVYMAFIDSDAYPDPVWLKNAVSFLDGNPDVWAVGGPNVTPPGEPFLQRVVGNAKSSFLVSGPLHFLKKRSPSRSCMSLHSCNLVIPRRVFDLVGSFDETLFSGEDRNLCDRIRAAGGRIYFNRDVVVYHHNRRLGKRFIGQCLTYGHGVVAISRKARNRFNMLLYLPVLWALLFLALLLYGAAVTNFIPVQLFVLACLLAASVEAVRLSSSLKEAVFTFTAILTCYGATTTGQLAALAGIQLDLRRLYANGPAPARPGNIPALSRVSGGMIRLIDRWVGIPLLYLFRLSGRRSRNTKDPGSSPQRVLFVKFWGIGNLLMTLPSICSMRKQWPNVQVAFLTLEHNREALETMGMIDRVTTISMGGPRAFLATWWSAVRALRGERYDVIIDCEQFARFSALVTRQINAPMTIGFETRGQSRHHLFSRVVPYNNEIHVTRSFHSLVQAAGVSPSHLEMQLEALPALQEHGRMVLARFEPRHDRAVVLIHVGTSANFSERRWPPDRYADLADLLIAHCRANIIFTGLSGERRLIGETIQRLRHPEYAVDISGKCTFRDYLALISAVALVISADTSAVHAASAVCTPVVGLYGPNTPVLYGPWNSNSITFYKKLDCSPCITNFNEKIHVCRHPDGKGACMARISSQEVFEAVAGRYFQHMLSTRTGVAEADRWSG